MPETVAVDGTVYGDITRAEERLTKLPWIELCLLKRREMREGRGGGGFMERKIGSRPLGLEDRRCQ